MSRDRCCVPGCLETGRSHQVLHGFPNPEKDPDRFRTWVYSVGGDILGLSNQYIYKHRRVCHGHFDVEYCCRYNRISNIAVPTINMPRTTIGIPTFTAVERRPLKAMHNLMADYPSTSKDPMICDLSFLNVEDNNTKVCCNEEDEKENVYQTAGKGIIPVECSETADLFYFMDNIFDSVNGSHYSKFRHAKPLLGPVTPKSAHKETWKQAIKSFQSMKFIRNGNYESVPTLQGWIQTLTGMQELIDMLQKKYNVTSFWMRHLNQDSLENFFGAIRNHGCRNINPTTQQFEAAFATLLINNLSSVHAPGTNCEDDQSKTLHGFIIGEGYEANETCEVDINDIVDLEITPFENKNDPKIIAPLQYVSGYFLKESKNKVWKGCENCKKILLSDQPHEYIKQREYAGRNWLHNPQNDFIKMMSEIQDITDFCLKKYIDKASLTL